MDAAADTEFGDFMSARWPGLVRLGYGLTGDPHSMKNLASELGCNHAEARAVLGGALDKLRQRLITP